MALSVLWTPQQPRLYFTPPRTKVAFYASKSIFTLKMKKYEAFELNDPEKASNFIPRTYSTREPSSVWKRCLIPFADMKCGTPEEDQDTFELTKKDAASGMGWNEGNLGSGREGSGATSHRGRKSRRANIREEEDDTGETVSELGRAVNTLKSYVSQPKCAQERKYHAIISYPELVATGAHVIEQQTNIDSKMKDARQNLHAILQNQFDRIKKALERLPQCGSFANENRSLCSVFCEPAQFISVH